MDSMYAKALEVLEQAHHELSNKVPQPRLIEIHGGFAFRYVEQSCRQAIIQKLARLVTGLRALELLLAAGLTQEQAALQRVVQEIDEDILFLAHSELQGTTTPLHDEYLEAFYQEEFDQPSALASTQRRLMIKRKKIRAYLSKIEVPNDNPAHVSRVARSIHSGYSGFVHAASPQVMELFDGKPPMAIERLTFDDVERIRRSIRPVP